MAELLIGASFAAAFVAGLAALFAPCCITVLLPTYLASVFRQKRTVFLMTFVFFIGLLVIFLPLGLGVAALGQLFSRYHDIIYTIGSIFLLALGASILLGMHFSLPFSVHANYPGIKARSLKTQSLKTQNVKIQDAGSVFGLGIFSGFATLCCAPVLAGVLALAVLPGSVFWGGMYSLAYALGMVVPLFFLAYMLDRIDFTKKFMAFKRHVSYSFAGKRINLTFANAIAAATFLSMGILISYLVRTGQLAVHSSYQTAMNIYLSNLTNIINQYIDWIPSSAWPLAVIGALSLIAGMAIVKWRN